VVAPIAAIVDLDRVRAGDPRMVRSGVGDVVCKLSAIADWQLSAADTGEQIDGLAVTMARTAAEAVLHQPGTIADDSFLTVLAESLVLCGLAMSVAGSSRPCSGGDHEILHAVNQLFPGTASHGELAGLGALYCSFIRINEADFTLLSACLARHGLPLTPAEAGLTAAEFTEAVLHAPATRPGRYTILEKLTMSPSSAAASVAAFEEAVRDAVA
jgi:glycerol-1-phosphate dehydrogenase [NAD(P)+]